MSSLARTHRRLASQWHPTKNGSLRSRDVTAGSHKRVWWRCPSGPDHEWEAAIYQRAATPGCPFCSGRRVCRSNSLAGQDNVVSRRLVRQWDRQKNAPLTPRDVTPGSNRRVHWRCRKGHEWQTSVNNRYRLETGCPYCSGRYVTEERSLAVTHPKLAREWDPERNGRLTPAAVSAGSEKRAWWRCPRDPEHVYEARVGHRAGAGSSCPFCANQRLTKSNSLAAKHPELALEWHPTKNGELSPHDVVAGTRRKVYWRCAKGHEWRTSVSNRPRTACPVCQGRKPDPAELVHRHRRLAAEWHPTKNVGRSPSEISIRSSRSVWWKCPAGPDHEWRDAPRNRIRDGLGCPFCKKKRASKAHSLSTTHPALARQWHSDKNGSLRPTDVLSGSGKRVFWKCEHGHEWRAAVYLRARPESPTGCPYCSNKKVAKDRSLAALNPKLARQWHPTKNGSLRPTEVVPGSNKNVWWKCKKGSDHEWRAQIPNRARRGDGCPFCSGRRASVTNSLARHHRRLARQWHPDKNGSLTAHDVPRGSAKRVWWKCEKGDDHEWEARVEVRVRYPTCPFCAGVRVCSATSLATLFPKVAREWHSKKNGDLRPTDVLGASPKHVWWKCPRRHAYRMSVRDRTLRERACPVCAEGR